MSAVVAAAVPPSIAPPPATTASSKQAPPPVSPDKEWDDPDMDMEREKEKMAAKRASEIAKATAEHQREWKELDDECEASAAKATSEEAPLPPPPKSIPTAVVVQAPTLHPEVHSIVLERVKFERQKALRLAQEQRASSAASPGLPPIAPEQLAKPVTTLIPLGPTKATAVMAPVEENNGTTAETVGDLTQPPSPTKRPTLHIKSGSRRDGAGDASSQASGGTGSESGSQASVGQEASGVDKSSARKRTASGISTRSTRRTVPRCAGPISLLKPVAEVESTTAEKPAAAAGRNRRSRKSMDESSSEIPTTGPRRQQQRMPARLSQAPPPKKQRAGRTRTSLPLPLATAADEVPEALDEVRRSNPPRSRCRATTKRAKDDTEDEGKNDGIEEDDTDDDKDYGTVSQIIDRCFFPKENRHYYKVRWENPAEADEWLPEDNLYDGEMLQAFRKRYDEFESEMRARLAGGATELDNELGGREPDPENDGSNPLLPPPLDPYQWLHTLPLAQSREMYSAFEGIFDNIKRQLEKTCQERKRLDSKYYADMQNAMSSIARAAVRTRVQGQRINAQNKRRDMEAREKAKQRAAAAAAASAALASHSSRSHRTTIASSSNGHCSDARESRLAHASRMADPKLDRLCHCRAPTRKRATSL